MIDVIILKGRPNSGKSITLREYLPPMLGGLIKRKYFYYRENDVFVFRRSIHESHNWKEVLEKILNKKDHIIVIPAWADEFINDSPWIKESLEDLLTNLSSSEFEFFVVQTQLFDSANEQTIDQRRCATEIKNLIDDIIG